MKINSLRLSSLVLCALLTSCNFKPAPRVQYVSVQGLVVVVCQKYDEREATLADCQAVDGPKIQQIRNATNVIVEEVEAQ
jgi:hypothetical protein